MVTQRDTGKCLVSMELVWHFGPAVWSKLQFICLKAASLLKLGLTCINVLLDM